MKLFSKKMSFLLAGCLFSACALAVPPTNLTVDKQAIMDYVNSGQYQKDIADALKEPKAYLQQKINENKQSAAPKKLAIVLDIDETSLSNYPDMVQLSFGGTMTEIDAREAEGDDPAILPTLELYKFAKANGVAVFFITGRREPAREKTAADLKQVGYRGWDGLYLRSDAVAHLKAQDYKTPIRCDLVKNGYEIVLNIGDQTGDLVGGCADKTVLLPNPFYKVP